jgi:solute carrier family 34 (sodium-dependent phosphate cotransporter)
MAVESKKTEETAPARPSGGRRGWSTAWRAIRIIGALYLFVGAIQLMKTGAGGLDIFTQGGFLVKNAGSTLGLGWIGAMLTLSGTPPAAAALTLTAAGNISEVQGFTMVTGARLGAAFVVLLVASLYAFRSGAGKRLKTVSTAVLALAITAVIYVPGAIIGLLLLESEPFHRVEIGAPPAFTNLVDLMYGWVLTPLETWPPGALFAIGFGLLIFSFRVIDAAMPEVTEDRFRGERLSWLRRKWPMFFLGIVVVILTLSVSVALTVLVPLVAKGYVKREHLIPYIVGADLGTLVDKLLVAFIAGVGAAHPHAPVRIILAELVGTGLMGLIIMSLLYMPFRRAVWKFQRQMIKTKPRLAAFTAALFVVPLLIIGGSSLIG